MWSEWDDTTTDAGERYLYVNMQKIGKSISGWSTNGQSGIWLGVGFGNGMDDVDEVTCDFTWYGATSASTSCQCWDRYSTQEARPSTDTYDNVDLVDCAFEQGTSSTVYNFRAQFKRKWTTSDTSYDTSITAQDSMKMSWAYGLRGSNLIQQHDSDDRGDFTIMISGGMKSIAVSALAALSVILMSAF